jgi:glucokinase
MATSSDDRYWVGFDLGGTKMLATVFNSDFEVVGRERKKTRGHEGPKSGVERMIRSVFEAVKDTKLDLSQICGIGVGVPGPVDMQQGIVIETANLGWHNVPLSEMLGEHFDCDIAILNDVDAGVYAENCFGAAKGARCVVGVFPGTGIGGGCVYEGKILTGQHSSCMEVGHVPLLTGGPLSGFGHRGTLEAVASRLAISGEAAQAAFRGQAPHLMKNAGTDISNIKSGALADSIKAGDQAVEAIVRKAAVHMGTAIAGVVNLLCPDVVVLGGGLVEAMPELIIESVKEGAMEFLLPSFRESFHVVAAELGDYATVQGAAAWVRNLATQGNKLSV